MVLYFLCGSQTLIFLHLLKAVNFFLDEVIRVIQFLKKTLLIDCVTLQQLQKLHQNEASLGCSRDLSKGKTNSDNYLVIYNHSAGNFHTLFSKGGTKFFPGETKIPP